MIFLLYIDNYTIFNNDSQRFLYIQFEFYYINEKRGKRIKDKQNLSDCFRIIKDSVHLDLKVIPGASKNEIAGIRDKRLYVRIAAPPQDGKANACLLGFLAKTLGCAKRDVALVMGEKSRLKTITLPLPCAEKLREYI